MKPVQMILQKVYKKLPTMYFTCYEKAFHRVRNLLNFRNRNNIYATMRFSYEVTIVQTRYNLEYHDTNMPYLTTEVLLK